MPASGGGAPNLSAAPARSRRHLLDRVLVAIEEALSRQLDAILHHPRFQKLEASWRGLFWLVRGIETGRRGRIRLLSASWSEIARDLGRMIEFDQSHMFRSIYENEFGRAGGEPYGMLLVDHEISHRPAPREAGAPASVDDLAVLGGLSAIAAASFAPVVVGAATALFGADRFEDLSLSTDILRLFDDEDHRRWRALASQEDSRFVSVVFSRLLARPRWRRSAIQRNGLRYEERVRDAADRPWFTGAYAFAGCVLRAFQDNAWPANIRGVMTDRIEGGLVVGAPEECFRLGPDTRYDRSSLALSLTEAQERGLVDAGLMPLNSMPHGDYAFGAARSLQTEWVAAPGRAPTPFLANRRLSSQINAVLAVSRFAHYVKMIARETLGSMSSPGDIEKRLRDWLFRHVNSNPNSSHEMRLRYPLRAAQVAVHELAGRPGSFGCVIHLQPHLQLDGVSTTFRLVTNFVA
ncbi:MAG: type VI secretion system contractile sheath large subunit [Gluconacetobacter diazotrophicus]|nr:type VI secretion system contractile sheath large subunit [Gluconacetobacter diazotrophicus]